MKVTYDEEVDIMMIRFAEYQDYSHSETKDHEIIFDLDKNGKLLGIEIMDASTRFSKEQILVMTGPKNFRKSTPLSEQSL